MIERYNKGFTPLDRRSRHLTGFTLIELLVVIAIIGLLATITLASLSVAQKKSRDSRRIGDLRQIASALEMYYDDNRVYPGDADITNCNDWVQMVAGLEGGGYMTQVPSDPGINVYHFETNLQDYILKATLERSNNPALDDDVDGTVFGCDCDDPVYCIRP